MKRFLFSLSSFSILAAMSASFAVLLSGCGNDEAPPSDPSYYKGPMKGKGEGSGAQTDKAAPQ